MINPEELVVNDTGGFKPVRWGIRALGASLITVGYSAIDTGIKIVDKSQKYYVTAENPVTISGFIVSALGGIIIYSASKIKNSTFEKGLVHLGLGDDDDYVNEEDDTCGNKVKAVSQFPIRDEPRQQQ